MVQQFFGNTIGRITTSGVVTTYTGTGINYPRDITTGPDRALWFSNYYNAGSIGRITPSGVVTNYTGTGIAAPAGITSGPDGALWFTNQFNNSIGRITTSGVVSNYTGTGIDEPIDITSGPDGALWFTNLGNGSIGRITTSGVVSNYTGSGIDGFGRDHVGSRRGTLVHQRDEQLDREDHHLGVVTTYTGTGIDGPAGITPGPRGALWFTNLGINVGYGSIGRITTSGVVTNYTGAPASTAPTTSRLEQTGRCGSPTNRTNRSDASPPKGW